MWRVIDAPHQSQHARHTGHLIGGHCPGLHQWRDSGGPERIYTLVDWPAVCSRCGAWTIARAPVCTKARCEGLAIRICLVCPAGCTAYAGKGL